MLRAGAGGTPKPVLVGMPTTKRAPSGLPEERVGQREDLLGDQV
jgi:hypothetical protein